MDNKIEEVKRGLYLSDRCQFCHDFGEKVESYLCERCRNKIFEWINSKGWSILQKESQLFEPKPSGRLLEEELKKVWLWWQESGENYGQLIDAVSAKTASIKDAEWTEIYYQRRKRQEKHYNVLMDYIQAECQARIEALIEELDGDCPHRIMADPDSDKDISLRKKRECWECIEALKAIHLKGGE